MNLDASPATDIARWSELENLDDKWAFRGERAVRFVSAGATVLDIGCGKMAIENMLPAGCRYLPVDVVARDSRTIVCDLNKGEYPLVADVTHIVVLGVVEYLANPGSFFEWLSKTSATRLIMSYVTLRAEVPPRRRRKLGWVNDLTRGDVAFLAERAGFSPAFEEWVSNNRLFVFDRASHDI